MTLGETNYIVYGKTIVRSYNIQPTQLIQIYVIAA